MEKKRLTRTDPWPAIERQEVESRQQSLPPLGSENLRVLAPEIGPAMHGIEDPDDHLTLLHKDGALTIGAAASRQPRVLVCKFGVDRHYGIQT